MIIHHLLPYCFIQTLILLFSQLMHVPFHPSTCSSTSFHNSSQCCQALNVFSDHLLLANKTFGECLSKHCLDHDGLENLSQKIPHSVLKRGTCALHKSPCLNFRHNCTGGKPEKNKPINSYKLAENTFSRWSEGAKQQQMTVFGTNSVYVTLAAASWRFLQEFLLSCCGEALRALQKGCLQDGRL